MADNSVQNGSDTIATDDIGGVKHQRVKVEYGADGSATDVSATTPLPVTLGTTAGLAALGVGATVTAYGAQRVTIEPSNVFSDAFDTTTGIDTTNKWTTGGTVAPTVATGAAQVRPGVTTASASSSLVSKAVFNWPGLNFHGLGFIARFENASASAGAAGYTNAHRFYGIGTVSGTWVAAYTASSTSGPILNGIGFEVDTDGFMYPVVYDNGTRTRPTLVNSQANLNVGRTLFNGQAHQFLIVMRAEAIFWYVDGTDVPVAMYTYSTTGFSQPDVAGLPIRFHQINATSATSGVTESRIGAVGLGDTGRNAQGIADGTYGWREASVTAPSEQFTGAQVGGSQGNALNVNPNAIQKATYISNIGTAHSMTAATTKMLATLHHAANATRTVRIRRIIVGALNGTATASNVIFGFSRGTAAPTAGSTTAPAPTNPGTVAAEVTFTATTSLAVVTTTTLHQEHYGNVAASGSLASRTIYDWAESGETIPLTLRAGNLDAITIWGLSSAAITLTPYITVYFTEE